MKSVFQEELTHTFDSLTVNSSIVCRLKPTPLWARVVGISACPSASASPRARAGTSPQYAGFRFFGLLLYDFGQFTELFLV